jgi:hypothetical protein
LETEVFLQSNIDIYVVIAIQEEFYISELQLYFMFIRPPPIQWVPVALSPGVKRQGHEANHSLPSSAKVKTGGAIPIFMV